MVHVRRYMLKGWLLHFHHEALKNHWTLVWNMALQLGQSVSVSTAAEERLAKAAAAPTSASTAAEEADAKSAATPPSASTAARGVLASIAAEQASVHRRRRCSCKDCAAGADAAP